MSDTSPPVNAGAIGALSPILSGNAPLIIVLAALGYMPLSSVSRSTEDVAQSQTEIREEIRNVRTDFAAAQSSLRSELDNLREGVATARADRWTRGDHQSFTAREIDPLRARVDRIERDIAVIRAAERKQEPTP